VVGDLDGSCSIEEQCSLAFTTCAGEEGNFKCMCQEDYVRNAAKNGCVKSGSQNQKFKIQFKKNNHLRSDTPGGIV